MKDYIARHCRNLIAELYGKQLLLTSHTTTTTTTGSSIWTRARQIQYESESLILIVSLLCARWMVALPLAVPIPRPLPTRLNLHEERVGIRVQVSFQSSMQRIAQQAYIGAFASMSGTM